MGAVKKLVVILIILVILLFGLIFVRNTVASLDSFLGGLDFEGELIPPDGHLGGSQTGDGSNDGGYDGDDATTQEATEAYQEYIAAYNRLTELMSQGLGDTPEAQQAYAEYKEAKENYEQIAKTLK